MSALLYLRAVVDSFNDVEELLQKVSLSTQSYTMVARTLPREYLLFRAVKKAR